MTAEATAAGMRREAGSPAQLPSGTLVDLFLRGSREYPRAESVYRRRADGTWEGLSRPQVADRVRRVAVGLRSLGYGRGDRVAILCETRLEWAVADYGLIMAGLVSVPVYPSLPADQAGYILKDAGARAAFVEDAEQLTKVLEIPDRHPDLERLFLIEGEPPGGTAGPEVLTVEDLVRRGEEAAAGTLDPGYEEYARDTEPSDLATLIYTSGTTGTPKGVMLSHDNFYSNVLQSQRILATSTEDTVLSWLPLSHVFERTAGHYLMWCSGVAVAYAESRDTIARDMREVRPTLMTGVPRFYEKVYEKARQAAESGGGLSAAIFRWAESVGVRRVEREQAGRRPGAWLALQNALADLLVFRKLRKRTGGRLRYLVSGGAPLPVHTAKFFHGAGLPVLEGYGLTETSPVVAVNPPDAVRLGTVGPPVPGTEVRVADDGELLVRGPQVMMGYLGKEEETRETLTEDGWLHTGDVGEIDAAGYLRITDRKKEIIVTSYGKNVAPQPVEKAAARSRFVDQAVLIGDGRKFLLMLVVPSFEDLRAWAGREGLEERDPEGLVAHERVRELLEAEVSEQTAGFDDHQRPKHVLPLAAAFSVESGELTPTLKVKRRVVAERYAEEIGRAYREAEEEYRSERRGEGEG